MRDQELHNRTTGFEVPKAEITLAVFPFEVFSPDQDLTLLTLGFTEDLVVNFTKFVGLNVISTHSTRSLTYAPNDEQVLQLGADYCVTGNFRTSANSIRIQVQLIRVRDGHIAFASVYEEPRNAWLDVQDRITLQIVNTLQQQIDYDLLTYSYHKESVDLQAYENYLLGMEHLRKGTLEDDEHARNYFRSALRVNPHYARAYTGLSLSYFNEWSCTLWDRWEVSRNGARDYALKALELDENDYMALAVLGRTYLYTEEYDQAEHCLHKSIRMNPNDASNLIQVAFSLIFLGETREAAELYHRAVQLNPHHSDSYYQYGATICFEQGDFKKALELGKKVSREYMWTDFPLYMSAICYCLSDWQSMDHYWRMFIELYKKNVNADSESLEQEALKWQEYINPYKNGKTNLRRFWDFKSGKQSLDTKEDDGETQVAEGTFICKGEVWELSFGGYTLSIEDSKGLRDIKRLLQHQDQSIGSMELMGGIDVDSKGFEVVDQQAKREYKVRINQLRDAIEEATSRGLYQEVEKLQAEYDSLIMYLSGAIGKGGQARKVGSSTEKSRAAVTLRIKSTIKKITASNKALGKHLSNSIKTGSYCVYSPEYPVNWKFE